MFRPSIALFALLPLAQAADAATPSNDASLDQVPRDVSAEISKALGSLDDAVDAGVPIDKELASLLQELQRLPKDGEMRARMVAATEQLIARTRAAFVGDLELAELRQTFVLARLDRAVSVLGQRARGGGWTASQAQAVLEGWVRRSRVFVDAPAPQEYRDKFLAVAEMNFRTAQSFAEAVQALRLALLDEQIDKAIEKLGAYEAEGSATAEDYAMIAKLLVIRRNM